MNGAIDKGAVARNFSAAAGSYDGWASAQGAIAEALVRLLPPDLRPSRIADLGCGTGTLGALLLARFPGASLVGVDLAEGMVERCRARFEGDSRARFLAGDVERPGSIPPGCDLVASSCAVQWLDDLPATLRMWAAALPPGGHLALATLVRGSFPELDGAHAEAFGVPFPGLDFPGEAELAAALRSGGLRLLASEPLVAVSPHADANEAIRSFRRIGARIPGLAPLSPARMRRLLAALGRRRDASGAVPLTHRALLLLARKERG